MNIVNAKYISSDRLTIDVELASDEYVGWYTYYPHDDAPMAQAIGEWFTNNPTFPIEDFTIPEVEPVDPLAKVLPRVAFLAMLDLMSEEKGIDIEAAILGFIETQMPSTTPEEKATRAVAKRLFTEGQEFVGTNPLFAVLVPAIGLSQSEFEAAWETAASFTW